MKELIEIQNELKAPKNQRNTFGNYNYRSAEDILEAVKPLLKKHGCHLTISDEMIQLGDRYYVKATATLSKDADVYKRQCIYLSKHTRYKPILLLVVKKSGCKVIWVYIRLLGIEM